MRILGCICVKQKAMEVLITKETQFPLWLKSFGLACVYNER